MTPVSVSAPVKAVAFLVFAAALAGATWGVQSFLGDDIVSAKALSPTLNATAGHTVTYPVTLSNLGGAEATFTLRLSAGALQSESVSALVVPGANRTLFVPLEVPEDAQPGEHSLRLDVTDATGTVVRSRDGFATLHVLDRAPGFEAGDTARVVYTGRTADTELVFNTNDGALFGQSFEQTDFYSPSPNLLVVTTVPRPSVVEGFYEGMLGMQPGESRTITFGPEKGYGPALQESEEEREEELERIFDLELRVEQVGRSTFDDYVEGSGQGNGTDFAAGDVFLFTQGPNQWPYRIVNITEDVVDYQLQVSEGMAFTLYPFWENASLVASVNETHVSFRTTPTTEVGEAFTMRSHWPNMTSVASMDDEHIVVRHDPPVGLKYSVAQGISQPPRDYTVVSVDDDHIVVSTPSTNPLAGKSLTFDVRVVELTKGA